MPAPGPWTRAVVTAALLLTAGCSDSSGGTAPEGGADPDEAAWATSTDPVETGGLVWASGSVVHLSDGSTIDVGGPLTTYVVAGDGVYFTPAESDEDGTEHGNTSTGPLRFAGRDGEVVDTGLTVYVESIDGSPDGRYLGLVDATSGEEDDFGTPVATAVVIDLTSGERVVDTTDGMGDPDADDLSHDYAEIYLRTRFLDDASVFVEGLGEDRVHSLPGGESEVVDPIDVRLPSQLDRTSPDGSWAIDDRGGVDVLLSADGERVRPRTGTPRWDLGWWFDDETVVGVALSGPGRGRSIGPEDTATLITCRVPDGACDDVEGTTGQLVRFPSEDSFVGPLDLRGSEAP